MSNGKKNKPLYFKRDNAIFVPTFTAGAITTRFTFFIDKCSKCGNNGRVWIDHGDCDDKECQAHKGFEDCDNCNIRSIYNKLSKEAPK